MILLPTRRRLNLLRRFLNSVNETVPMSQGLIIVDQTDFDDNRDQYNDLPKLERWNLVVSKAESMGDKVREAFPIVKKSRWVGLLNDDHICATKDWDKITDELIDGTNMVSTGDGRWNFGFRVCGLTAWSTPLLEACGFPIFPRTLQHLYIDDIWKAIGEKTGCWKETLRMDFPHKHALKGEMEQDDTFKKVYADEAFKADQKIYNEFMAEDFKGVCERIMKLREEKTLDGRFC